MQYGAVEKNLWVFFYSWYFLQSGTVHFK